MLTLKQREGEGEIGAKRGKPAPWLEELDPVAIGEGDGMSVECMPAAVLPVTKC
jgi:hypothetical protein